MLETVSLDVEVDKAILGVAKDYNEAVQVEKELKAQVLYIQFWDFAMTAWF